MSDKAVEPVVSAPRTDGWHSDSSPSLPESNRSITIPKNLGFWRKLLAFSGPGYLVAVGYMDPGNWATDIAGGSAFGYRLLSVILMSNLMAILLQSLCARLGIATGRDLAQACRDHYSQPVSMVLWVLCEIAICACDLAEVIGSAIALQLLFHIPMTAGVLITSLDVLAVMVLQNRGFRYIESVVIILILTIGCCFVAEIFFSKPDFVAVLNGFIPSTQLISDPKMLYLAIGILGATVMPHNLYLHSSIVQTRKYEQTLEGKREAIRFASLDGTLALMLALFINAAILIVAGATFYTRGEHGVDDITKAHEMLKPMLGVGAASVLFAVALLASGQSSTLTGTLAGQIVMEGFLNWRIRPWLRRLITRLIAIIPAIICTMIYGEKAVGNLLVFSQVVLSLQLSFAVIPLIIFTSDRKKMGLLVNPTWLTVLGWITASIIVILNVKYLFDFVMEHIK
ncbi:MAG: Mn2+/Fe2+ transporter, family [Verrucomicrobiales bacterium]|nr:Mn2+/Fe2+ transporter, family [Verrucomicrobiales bacterium]